MTKHDSIKSKPVLALTTILIQPWSAPCDLAKGLKQGTIFPDLCFPFYIGGDENDK